MPDSPLFLWLPFFPGGRGGWRRRTGCRNRVELLQVEVEVGIRIIHRRVWGIWLMIWSRRHASLTRRWCASVEGRRRQFLEIYEHRSLAFVSAITKTRG